MSSVLSFSQAMPLRMVITQQEGLNTRNPDNILFKDMGKPFFDTGIYWQPWQMDDLLTVQWKSSFDTNVIKLYNHLTGVQVGIDISPDVAITVDTTQVLEKAIDLSGLAEDGVYELRISGSHSDLKTYAAVSEPFRIRADWKGTVLLKYYNNEPAFGVDYRTGVDFYLRVQGRFVKPADENDLESARDSGNSLEKISDVIYEGRLLELFRVPAWMVSKVNLFLAHDYQEIDGVLVSGNEKLAHDYGYYHLIGSPSVAVPLRDTDQQNLFDDGERQLLPEPPSGLAFMYLSGTSILFSWDDNSDDETGFEVQRSTDGVTWTNVGSPVANDESVTASGLTLGVEYTFRVRTVSAAGYSAWVSLTGITTPTSVLSIYTTYAPGVGIGNLDIEVGNVTATSIFVLPDSSNWETNNLVTSDAMFDGTSKLVQILLFDVDPYIDLTFGANMKPTGVLDLSGIKLKSFYQQGEYQENIGTITSFLTPTQTEACSIRILQDIMNCAVDLTGLSNLTDYCIISSRITSFTYNPAVANSNPIAVNIRNTYSPANYYVGALDLSKFTNMTLIDIIGGHPNMTAITLPATNPNCTSFFRIQARNALVNGSATLDVSTLAANCATNISIQCAATNIKMPTVGTFTSVEIIYCKNIGSLDVTGLKMAANATFSMDGGNSTGTGFTLDFSTMAAFTGLKFYSSSTPISSCVFSTGSTFRFFQVAYMVGYTSTPDYSNLRFSAGAERFSDHTNGAGRTITLPSVQQTVDGMQVGILTDGVTYSPLDFTSAVLARKYWLFSQSATSATMDLRIGYIYANRAAIIAAFPSGIPEIASDISVTAIQYENETPSGTYQAPSGFVKGSSDGSPASALEQLYVLVENYNYVATWWNHTENVNYTAGSLKEVTELEMASADKGSIRVRKISGSTYVTTFRDSVTLDLIARLVTVGTSSLTKIGSVDVTVALDSANNAALLPVTHADFKGFIVMYRNNTSTAGVLKLFECELDVSGNYTGVITERDSVTFEPTLFSTSPSDMDWLTENERLLLSWTGPDADGFARSVDVDLDLKTFSINAVREWDGSNGTHSSIERIDANHAQLWYRGVDNDGFSLILNVDTDGLVTVVGSGIEFDIADNAQNAGVNINTTKSINFWVGVDDDAFVQMYEFNTSTGVITGMDAVKEFSPATTISRNNARKLSSSKVINFYNDSALSKTRGLLVHYNTTTGVLTLYPYVEQDDLTTVNGIAVVDEDTVIVGGNTPGGATVLRMLQVYSYN